MTKAGDQNTRGQLLRAAVLELADKGWGGLRTRSVAARAGVNKGLVHYHFGTMDNLRLEAVADVMTGAVGEAAAVLLSEATLAAGIRAFCTHLDVFTAESPEGVVLVEAMVHVPREPQLREMLVQTLEAYETALAARIAADIAAGAGSPDIDPAALATAITALLDGLVLHAYVRPPGDLAAAGDALAALFTNTIEPED